MNKQVEKDLRTAEMLAFPLLFLLSLLFFRSGVAALLPLMVGGLAIVGTFLLLRIASEFGSISIFALNLTTGLGLGLAIDYSLFVVSRYREEIARHGPGLAAMRRTMATAGRTVFFSSLTVAAALASLLVFPQRFLYSMGLGGALVALLAAPIALTVLPAVLALLGDAGQRLAPKFLQRRAERDARPDRVGLLVPPLPLRSCAGRSGSRRSARAADRPRHPVLGSSSPPSTRRCCPRRQRQAGSTTCSAPSSRRSATPRSGSCRGRLAAGGRAGRGGRARTRRLVAVAAPQLPDGDVP